MALDDGGEVGLRVRTSSDNQNVWMHAINRELGFVPVESEVLLQKRRDGADGA